MPESVSFEIGGPHAGHRDRRTGEASQRLRLGPLRRSERRPRRRHRLRETPRRHRLLPADLRLRREDVRRRQNPGRLHQARRPPVRTRRRSASRQIDRPIRPLFPDGFRNDVQIIATVLSIDPELDADVLARLRRRRGARRLRHPVREERSPRFASDATRTASTSSIRRCRNTKPAAWTSSSPARPTR